MIEFRECLNTSELSDISFQGPLFTWWNNQDSMPILKKLDRVLVNDRWRAVFPHSYGTFEPMAFSDHRPGTLHFGERLHPKTSFKVSNHLLDHPKYLDMLRDFWDATHIAGSAMFTLARKLKLLKPVLKGFHRRVYSNIEIRVQDAFKEMCISQGVLLDNPSPGAAGVYKRKYAKWWALREAEDKFLRQRARVKWIQDGDRNTSLFHKSIQARRSANRIHYLMDQEDKLERQCEMADHSVAFFGDLLGREQVPLTQEEKQAIWESTKFRCDPRDGDLLQADVTEAEIKAEVFDLPMNKCPGPDGFNAEFFIKSWPVIGGDVTQAVKEFFDQGSLLRQYNSTAIALIPKFQGADKLTDFRPISLCNVLYKVISRVLTRRLQAVLKDFISPSQAAFVQGRLLTENVLLATELVRGFGTKNVSRRGAFKVDLTKAFDSVRWEFIIVILQAAGFPVRYINWIRECVTSTSFSVCVNGELCGYFKGTRGLRQGDPLSPYLFLIAMEVFSELLKAGFRSGSIKYHDLCRDPEITHLSFADDILIFFDGSPESLAGIKNVFDVFQDLSGLRLSIAKSTLYYSGLSPEEETQVAQHGFTIGQLPVRYLGLPLMTRRMSRQDYSPLLDSLTKRFTSWTVRNISFSGRLQLISSVIYGVTNFWMGAFLLPKGCIRDVIRLCSRFLWSGDVLQKGKAKVAWKLLSLPKSEGGLGLRDLYTWNKVLHLKLVWLLFSKPESLWVKWIHRHRLRKHVFWTAPVSPQTSWSWRSLLSLRPLAIQMLHCRLGNGEHASFWFDKWHVQGPLIDILGQDGPQRLGVPHVARVIEACRDGAWILPPERTRCERMALLRAVLLGVQIPGSLAGKDTYFWGTDFNKKQKFSSSSTWDALRPRDLEKEWSKVVWFKSAIPKHSFLLWVISLDRLPLRSRLHRWGVAASDSCCLCSLHSEDRNHLFINCDYSRQIWSWLGIKLDRSSDFSSWDELIHWLCSAPSRGQRILCNLAGHTVIYNIWRERNNRLHASTSRPAASLIQDIDRTVRATLFAGRRRKHHGGLLSAWFRYS